MILNPINPKTKIEVREDGSIFGSEPILFFQIEGERGGAKVQQLVRWMDTRGNGGQDLRDVPGYDDIAQIIDAAAKLKYGVAGPWREQLWDSLDEREKDCWRWRVRPEVTAAISWKEWLESLRPDAIAP